VESVRGTLSLFRIWRMNLLCVLIFFGYGPHKLTALSHECGARIILFSSSQERVCLLSFFFQNPVPLLSYPSGLYMSFWQGQFPLIVGNKDDRIPLPSSFKPSGIGYLMIVVGSGEVLGACEIEW